MVKIKTTKFCAGCYMVAATDPRTGEKLEVEVVSHEELAPTPWVARAQWSQYTYSDPCWTKREAVEAAKKMIENRIAGII